MLFIYKKLGKNFIKTIIKSTFIFIGLILGSFAAESVPFHYEAQITVTPDIHSITEKISMEDLKRADYDLSKFTVTVKLEKEQAIDAFLKNRLLKNWQSMKEDEYNTYLHSEPLRQYIFAFLEIEAEAIFYRDLASKMQANHSNLNNNELYKNHLSSNWKLFEGLLDITAGKDGDMLEFLSKMMQMQGTKKVKYKGKEVYGFEKLLLQDERFNPSDMLDKAKKVK